MAVARRTVARSMAEGDLAGAARGNPVRTTRRNPAVPCPKDRVNRQFHASSRNQLWVFDFAYAAT